MKKTLTLLAIGLLAIAACDKQKEVTINLSNAPEWVADESQSVPVQFGGGIFGGIVTKGEALSSDGFAEAQYDILAVKADGTAMPNFEGGRYVSNQTHTIVGGARDGESILTVNFGATLFYPYLSTGGNAYSFYGYRVDGTHQTLNANNVVESIAIGQNDIIWAASEASADNLAALEVPDGFNARYMRAAYKHSLEGENLNETLYYSYLPQLSFNHITSQLQFQIRAADEYAANSLASAGVGIHSITVKNTTTGATLAVLTGDLTGTTTGNVDVAGINDQLPLYVVVNQLPVAADCGEPIFILPCDSIDFDIVITMPVGAPSTTETISTTAYVPQVGGEATTFEAGKKYNLTIVFQSIEEIKIVTELTEWEEVDVDDIVME